MNRTALALILLGSAVLWLGDGAPASARQAAPEASTRLDLGQLNLQVVRVERVNRIASQLGVDASPKPGFTLAVAHLRGQASAPCRVLLASDGFLALHAPDEPPKEGDVPVSSVRSIAVTYPNSAIWLAPREGGAVSIAPTIKPGAVEMQVAFPVPDSVTHIQVHYWVTVEGETKISAKP